MKPKTELQPSTKLRRAVVGGSLNSFPTALLVPVRKVLAAVLPRFLKDSMRNPKVRSAIVLAADDALVKQYPVARLVRADLRRRILRERLDELLDNWLMPTPPAAPPARGARAGARAGRAVPRPKDDVAAMGDGFEGFMIKLRASGKIATARRVVKKALAGSWSVKDFARGSRQFEVASNKVSMSAAEAWEATYRLRAQPGVGWAEPCFTVPLEAPARLRAKGRRASGGGGGPAPANPQWSVNMVKTREAWAFSTQTGNPAQGAGIVLGHPDTGCTTHSEVLSPRLLKQLGYDFWDSDSDPTDPMDSGVGCTISADFLCFPGHGTGTSSVIFSDDNAGAAKFVVGIAPAAKLIPFRVAPTVVLWSMKRLAAAIRRATDSGCHVISISMGGPGANTLHEAVQYAAERGVIVCCAVGNQWPWVVWPAVYDECIAVAACNINEKPWSGSASGEAVDITAPGENVYRAYFNKKQKADVGPGSGTSFAVATTAGVAALWLAHHGIDRLKSNSRVSAPNIPPLFFSILTKYGYNKPAGWNTSSYGPGIIDAEKILKAPLPTAQPASARRRVKVLSPSEGNLGEFANLFPELSPAELRNRLASALGATHSTLPARLREVGDELLFHLAVNTEERERFAGFSPAGRKVGAKASLRASTTALRAAASPTLAKYLN